MSLISKAFALYKIFSRDSFGEGQPFLVTRRRHGSHFLRASFAGRRISLKSQTEEHAPGRKKSFHVGHNELANYSLTRAFFCFYRKVMEVDLTADQREFIRHSIETGRFHRAEDAVREALLLWEERERRRAEILAAVDTAEASLSRGEGRAVTQQSMRELASEVKQRGRLRLDAKQQTPR
jgi:putative addiction module CopG family antidote